MGWQLWKGERIIFFLSFYYVLGFFIMYVVWFSCGVKYFVIIFMFNFDMYLYKIRYYFILCLRN